MLFFNLDYSNRGIFVSESITLSFLYYYLYVNFNPSLLWIALTCRLIQVPRFDNTVNPEKAIHMFDYPRLQIFALK